LDKDSILRRPFPLDIRIEKREFRVREGNISKMKMARWHESLALCIVAALWITACGGSVSTTTPPQKQTPTISAWPAASPITYGQTLASSTLTGGTASVAGTFAWTTSTTAPGAGTPSESVTFTPNDTNDYNTVAGSVGITVNKATPTVSSWPTASAINYGQTLASSTLSGGTASVPGAFAWTTSTTAPATGTSSQSVTFTPTDASDYNTVAGSTNVTVSKATPTVSAWPTASAITYGQTLASSTLSGGTASVPGVFSWTTPATAPAAGTASQSVTFTPTDTTDYNAETGSASVTVNKATPTVSAWPTASAITYGQTLASSTLSGGTASVAGAFSWTAPTTQPTAGTPSESVTFTPTNAADYNTVTGSVSVTVNSATPYTLTVDSAAPSSGITVIANPVDNNGKGGSTPLTTPFTLTYNSGTAVSLSVGPTDNGYTFVSWGGCTTPNGTTCGVTLNGNTTVTANYNQSGITSITVTPTTATIGTQQQFTATVHGNGSFSSAVTWSMSPATGAGSISSTGLYNTPYPAPATVTITATSTQNTSISGSATVTLSPPATTAGPALSVDLDTPSTPAENPHTISPYVYGMNGYLLDTASEKIGNPGIVRWGGDATSRYNYQNNMANSASDYYFESFPGEGGMFPNATGSSNFPQFFQAVDSAGSAALGTVPVNGWVTNSNQNVCSFTATQFPDQQEFDPYHSSCGNGVLTSGTDLNGNSGTSPTQIPDITGLSTPPPCTATTSTDTNCTAIPAAGSVTSTWANGTWSGGWVNSIVTGSGYGNGASGKGVAVWDLDNEPTWWDAVHRDVHPAPFTYDEATNNGIGTALAIKTADPTALVSGPVIDYWWAYFYSKKDIESGWDSGSPCYQPWSNPVDRAAHGGVPMIEYYLQQFNSFSKQYGVRLLDFVDIHGYFAPDYPAGSGNSVAFTTAGDTPEQEARMNSTRVFWDPTYTDSSNNYPQPNYSTDPNYTGASDCAPPQQAPQLIPMIQSWIASADAAVSTSFAAPLPAIDEYNFGGLESINGAIVQADILGIFGRQGLGMGAFWPSTNYVDQGPGNYAFAMYRNYDGNDSVFGNTYLYATSTGTGGDGEGQLAVYAAQRTSDNAITVMVINKTYGSLTSTISLENFTAASGTTAQVYQYSNANLSAISSQPAVTVTPPAGSGTTSTIGNYSFPGQSITLFVVPD
jgi:Glycoside hydrolase family 44